jgi:hypothetical protein
MLSQAHTWTLTIVSIAAGFAMLWAFGQFSDQARIENAKRKVRAHLYAFRLYSDEPALIFRAQKQLLLWNGRYLGLMLRPMAVTIIPMVILLMQLDGVYGRRPLAPGEAAIVTVQLDNRSDLSRIMPSLDGRAVAVETPPVRIPEEHQVCWRVRATGAESGTVLLHIPGLGVAKEVQSGPALGYVPERRVASLLEWFRYPGERTLPGGAVQWIEVSYPPADLDVFGFAVNWLVWFCLVSILTMLLFRKRFGVTF